MTTKKVENPVEKIKQPEQILRELIQDVVDTARKVDEAKAGRQLGDIPMRDTYWDMQRLHQAAYNKLRDFQAK
jgi:hypothetical protein